MVGVPKRGRWVSDHPIVETYCLSAGHATQLNCRSRVQETIASVAGDVVATVV